MEIEMLKADNVTKVYYMHICISSIVFREFDEIDTAARISGG